MFAAVALRRLGRDSEAIRQCQFMLTVQPGNAGCQTLMDEIERGGTR